MKFFILLISSLLLTISVASGQSLNDTIFIDKTNGTRFFYHGKYLNNKQLYNITKSNFEANFEMRKARSTMTASYVIAFTGGYLIGWQLGLAAAGKSPNWSVAALGAGLIVVSIPFNRSFSVYAERAALIYNKGLIDMHGRNVIIWDLALSGNGIGLRVVF